MVVFIVMLNDGKSIFKELGSLGEQEGGQIAQTLRFRAVT